MVCCNWPLGNAVLVYLKEERRRTSQTDIAGRGWQLDQRKPDRVSVDLQLWQQVMSEDQKLASE